MKQSMSWLMVRPPVVIPCWVYCWACEHWKEKSMTTFTVNDALQISWLREAQVRAGAAGLTRPVTSVNVMEVPDILPWVRPHELLLTTLYPLRDVPNSL